MARALASCVLASVLGQRQPSKSITDLNLSWNRIEDDGCLPIARLLGPLSALAAIKAQREKTAAALVKVPTRPRAVVCVCAVCVDARVCVCLRVCPCVRVRLWPRLPATLRGCVFLPRRLRVCRPLSARRTCPVGFASCTAWLW